MFPYPYPWAETVSLKVTNLSQRRAFYFDFTFKPLVKCSVNYWSESLPSIYGPRTNNPDEKKIKSTSVNVGSCTEANPFN